MEYFSGALKIVSRWFFQICKWYIIFSKQRTFLVQSLSESIPLCLGVSPSPISPPKSSTSKKTCVFDDERHPLFFAFQDPPVFCCCFFAGSFLRVNTLNTRGVFGWFKPPPPGWLVHPQDDTVPKVNCFEEGMFYASPAKMEATERTVELSAELCQQRCQVVPECAHFTFWPAPWVLRNMLGG